MENNIYDANYIACGGTLDNCHKDDTHDCCLDRCDDNMANTLRRRIQIRQQIELRVLFSFQINGKCVSDVVPKVDTSYLIIHCVAAFYFVIFQIRMDYLMGSHNACEGFGKNGRGDCSSPLPFLVGTENTCYLSCFFISVNSSRVISPLA